MLTNGDEGRRGDEISFMLGEEDLHATLFLSIQNVPHVLEVLQRTSREPITLGGLQVDLVESRQVFTGSELDLDAKLVGFLDVATPQLIHTLEELVLSLLSAILVA